MVKRVWQRQVYWRTTKKVRQTNDAYIKWNARWRGGVLGKAESRKFDPFQLRISFDDGAQLHDGFYILHISTRCACTALATTVISNKMQHTSKGSQQVSATESFA